MGARGFPRQRCDCRAREPAADHSAAGLFAGLEDYGTNSGDAAGDSYVSIENLIGSAFDDIFYGTNENNRFTGGDGNDLMVGKGGADTFDGGAGTDTVAYDASFPYSGNFAIRADLLSPGTNTGDATGDAYISIENLEGSAFDDMLLGTNNASVIRGNHYPGLSGADQLFGRGGNDTLFGNDQDDTLVGGTGRDVMTGGSGADDFDFNAAAETGTTGSTPTGLPTLPISPMTSTCPPSTLTAGQRGTPRSAFSRLRAQNSPEHVANCAGFNRSSATRPSLPGTSMATPSPISRSNSPA